jgi:uncharacterized protein YkwD
VAVAALMVAVGCAAPTAPDALPAVASAAGWAEATPPAATAVVLVVSTVLALTNVERSKAGLPPFRASDRLMHAAQLHSDQMGALARMDHVLPGAKYPNPADRLAAANYAWQAYAENVAVGQASGAAVVAAWMQSSGHRANILNANYTELGVGHALDSSGRPYYTQVFGRPAS